MSQVDGLVQLSFCFMAGAAIINGGDAGFVHGRETALGREAAINMVSMTSTIA